VSKGIAKVTLEDDIFILNERDSLEIPILSKHRLENDTQNLLEIIEVQFGEILSEDDIKRYEDKYQRD
jgi:mannose-1-phosphate guanylyltransferase/mannose-6-phosphate isomerase